MNEEHVEPDQGPTLLFIEPQQPPSDRPVVDDLTRKLAGAYRLSRPADYEFMGDHQCSCGAFSDSTDHYLPDGSKTNSLCVHYLAYHRQEVPEVELEFVRGLLVDGVEPTTDELHGPRVIGRRAPAPIDRLRKVYLEARAK
jgi:hypothetical protein